MSASKQLPQNQSSKKPIARLQAGEFQLHLLHSIKHQMKSIKFNVHHTAQVQVLIKRHHWYFWCLPYSNRYHCYHPIQVHIGTRLMNLFKVSQSSKQPTLPETNISPVNWWFLKNYLPFQDVMFSVFLLVSFRVPGPHPGPSWKNNGQPWLWNHPRKQLSLPEPGEADSIDTTCTENSNENWLMKVWWYTDDILMVDDAWWLLICNH